MVAWKACPKFENEWTEVEPGLRTFLRFFCEKFVGLDMFFATVFDIFIFIWDIREFWMPKSGMEGLESQDTLPCRMFDGDVLQRFKVCTKKVEGKNQGLIAVTR